MKKQRTIPEWKTRDAQPSIMHQSWLDSASEIEDISGVFGEIWI